MSVLFGASTDGFSAQHTGRFIIPLLLHFFPHISSQAIDLIHLGIRKAAHLAEYSILGILLWRATPVHKTNPEVADWWRAGVAVLVATFYAATDEYHQSFVPSRVSSLHDVLIDMCGAAIAVTILSLANRNRPPNPTAAPAPAA
jgi:VanZ family protein